jgi:uncharacterized membrane protein YgdD (TMEM256/DUF423 family)
MQRMWIGLGGLTGCTAVAMAAVLAHAVPDIAPAARRAAESGLQMQGWHTLAMMAAALWAPRGSVRSWYVAQAAAAAFFIGMLMFCGATYSVGLAGVSLGVVAPIGGTLLMLGWLLLTVSALIPPGRR